MKRNFYRLAAIMMLGWIIPYAGNTQEKSKHAPMIDVEARKNARDPQWKSYSTQTYDRIPGYKERKSPPVNQYGSWMTNRQEATGFFRTQQIDGRWWLIDPEGYPFYCKGVAVYRPGSSDRQRRALKGKYGSDEQWAEQETAMLKGYGFNAAGAWSNVGLLRRMEQPLVYTVIVNPMGNYRAEHRKRFGGKYRVAGWQGYRFDLPMVFDPEFDTYVEKSIAPLAQYRDDKFLLGYFTDNELPWPDDMLRRHLTLLAKDEAGYLAARDWLDRRKGHDGATLDEVTQADERAFYAYVFETYMKKVTRALRKVDPNHLFLGCRFNQERNQELTSPEIFEVAGRYMDVISINHYRHWQPSRERMAAWGEWSGKPFLITEWYVKGEDSGLPNNTGAGWNVHTQLDRGYFYQNFTIELLKSKNCVGWHWFTYQDNDPENLKTDPSNRDSNKGVVDNDFNPYVPMLEKAAEINLNVWNLIRFFDSGRGQQK